MIFISAFTLGLFGSLHCLGMCGPIVMALPLTSAEKSEVFIQSLIYNLGRILTYALMGVAMGALGWGIAFVGYQRFFSILMGSLLIISVLLSLLGKSHLVRNTFFTKLNKRIKSAFTRLLSIKNRKSAFSIGALNGILPCGLVYIALAGAVFSGSVMNGGIYMLLFGLGTLPMMLGAMTLSKFYKNQFLKLRRFIPIAVVLFGLLLIYRGIQMEIPRNLEFWESTNFQIMCH